MFRLLTQIVLLLALILLVIQNLQPIALVLFGSKTSAFPLGVWVISFLAAGFFTSLYLQLLTNSSRPQKSSQSDRREPNIPPSESPPREINPPQPLKERRLKDSDKDDSRFVASSPLIADQSGWENENNENDWNIEEPPEITTTYQGSYSEDKVQESASNFEIPQQPKASSQQGTIYSYTYREKSQKSDKQDQANPPKTVYDADYRVITPPYPQETESPLDQDEPEDWI